MDNLEQQPEQPASTSSAKTDLDLPEFLAENYKDETPDVSTSSTDTSSDGSKIGWLNSDEFDETGKPKSNLNSGIEPPWKGDPRYYQTGKKAGQLRPVRLNKQPVEISGNLIISGALLLMFIDMVFPVLISLANNRINKKTQVKPEQLRLTDEQKTQLIPLADAAAKNITVTANPFAVLGVALFGMYGANFISAINEND
jgi:hypothetical protein